MGTIKEVEEHLGELILKTRKGGKHGGKTEITRARLSLLTNYKRLKETMAKAYEME